MGDPQDYAGFESLVCRNWPATVVLRVSFESLPRHPQGNFFSQLRQYLLRSSLGRSVPLDRAEASGRGSSNGSNQGAHPAPAPLR